MKKLLLIFVGLVLAVSISDAVISQNTITAINASTYTAIMASKGSAFCRPVTVWTSDATAFWVSSNSSGTDAVQIPASSSYSSSCVKDTNGVIMYVKATAGTPNIYLSIGLPKK